MLLEDLTRHLHPHLAFPRHTFGVLGGFFVFFLREKSWLSFCMRVSVSCLGASWTWRMAVLYAIDQAILNSPIFSPGFYSAFCWIVYFAIVRLQLSCPIYWLPSFFCISLKGYDKLWPFLLGTSHIYFSSCRNLLDFPSTLILNFNFFGLTIFLSFCKSYFYFKGVSEVTGGNI